MVILTGQENVAGQRAPDDGSTGHVHAAGAVISPARGSPAVSALPGSGNFDVGAHSSPYFGTQRALERWRMLEAQKLQRMERTETMERRRHRKEFDDLRRRYFDSKKTKADVVRDSPVAGGSCRSSTSATLAGSAACSRSLAPQLSAQMTSSSALSIERMPNEATPPGDVTVSSLKMAYNGGDYVRPFAAEVPSQTSTKRKMTQARNNGNWPITSSTKCPIQQKHPKFFHHTPAVPCTPYANLQIPPGFVNGGSFAVPPDGSGNENRQSNGYYAAVEKPQNTAKRFQFSGDFDATSFARTASASSNAAGNRQPSCDANGQSANSSGNDEQLLDLPDFSPELLTQFLNNSCQFLDDASTNAALCDVFGAEPSSTNQCSETDDSANRNSSQNSAPPTLRPMVVDRSSTTRFGNLTSRDYFASVAEFDQCVKVEPQSPPTNRVTSAALAPPTSSIKLVRGYGTVPASVFPVPRELHGTVDYQSLQPPPYLLPETTTASDWTRASSNQRSSSTIVPNMQSQTPNCCVFPSNYHQQQFDGMQNSVVPFDDVRIRPEISYQPAHQHFMPNHNATTANYSMPRFMTSHSAGEPPVATGGSLRGRFDYGFNALASSAQTYANQAVNMRQSGALFQQSNF